MSAKHAAPLHPFYPLELELLEYVANTRKITELLTGFFATWGLILAVTYVISKKYNPKLSNVDTAAVLWFVLSGTIHFFFEGYFSYNHTRMSSQQDLFGQLWKEYAQSDSRYLTSDPFVLCMETITAVLWGPLSFLSVYLIASNNPYRHQIQSLVSIGQIYGCVLYYATNAFAGYYSGVEYSRPEWLYYWFYYVIINAIWIVIPTALIYQSWTATASAFKTMNKVEKTLANGSANGHANGNGKKRN